MKKIKLTGKYGGGRFALVDDADYENVRQYTWAAHKAGRNYYARCSRKNVPRLMHRLILGEIPKVTYLDTGRARRYW